MPSLNCNNICALSVVIDKFDDQQNKYKLKEKHNLYKKKTKRMKQMLF